MPGLYLTLIAGLSDVKHLEVTVGSCETSTEPLKQSNERSATAWQQKHEIGEGRPGPDGGFTVKRYDMESRRAGSWLPD